MKLSHHVLVLLFYHVKGTDTIISLVPLTFGQDESLFLLTCSRICVLEIYLYVFMCFFKFYVFIYPIFFGGMFVLLRMYEFLVAVMLRLELLPLSSDCMFEEF